jgi:hypothetical protein
VPTNYSADGFFEVFGLAFDFALTAVDNINYTSFQYLDYVVDNLFVQEYLEESTHQGPAFDSSALQDLRALLAVPVLVFNQQFLNGTITNPFVPADNHNKTINFAAPGYRVCSQYSY